MQQKLSGRETWLNLFLWVPISLGLTLGILLSSPLGQDNKGHYMYACFHGRDERWIRPLPEVYYVQKTGNTDEKLKGPTLATWALRLLAEAGVLRPIDDVGLPELKVGSEGERKVYEGLKLLFSVRWTYSPGDPTPFSWRFAEDWCGVAQATAGKAIQKFLKLGVIHTAGKHKNTTLFLPGRGERVVRLRLGRKGESAAGPHGAAVPPAPLTRSRRTAPHQ